MSGNNNVLESKEMNSIWDGYKYGQRMIDILSDEVINIISLIITDPRLRVIVLADAYAKDHVRNHYSGNNMFSILDESDSNVAEMVAGHIIDFDPELYMDFMEMMCGNQFDNVCFDDKDDGTHSCHTESA